MVISGTTQISGVVVKDPASHVLTASLPLGTGPLVTIQTGTGQRFNGWIVGRDDKQNLALIKVVGATLPGVVWGDAYSLGIESEMLSLGYPLASEGKLFTAAAKLAGVQQDLVTGLRFLQLNVPHRTGITGGPAVNRQGETVGIAIDPSFVLSLGISLAPGAAYVLSSDSVLQVLPLLKQGVLAIARPTPTPNPNFGPLGFEIFQGTIRVNGQLPAAGMRVYARIVGSGGVADVWAPPKGEEVKSGGTYSITVSAAAELYANATIEFYVEGVKANETGTYRPADFLVDLNLTFP